MEAGVLGASHGPFQPANSPVKLNSLGIATKIEDY
jgi:hypothetical protein